MPKLAQLIITIITVEDDDYLNLDVNLVDNDVLEIFTKSHDCPPE